MLELIRYVLEKIDFLSVSEALRKRGNRTSAARLHLILVKSYEVLEIYRVLLEELRGALETWEKGDASYKFRLNLHRVEWLLNQQAANLEIIEALIIDTLDELRVVDQQFAAAYRAILPGKFGILVAAQGLLSTARLPIGETGPGAFPADSDGTYRTLWFTPNLPKDNRRETEKYLHGWNGTEKDVIDVHVNDGEQFFAQLRWYFDTQDPVRRLDEIERNTEAYKQALIDNFTLEEIISDIGRVRKFY